MKKITIGGVPEHFNLPWLDTLQGSAQRQREFAWQAQPQGTGAMVEALRSGELDAALLLTEGAVAAVAAGAPLDIVANYVDTPLQWGIHVPPRLTLQSEAEIAGLRYAISRRGSGSHLMAVAHARTVGIALDALEFVVVGTLAGARAAFEAGRAEVFFWERFMTAPLVEAGEFTRLGVFEAPWPAFVLCVARTLEAERRRRLMALFGDVLSAARAFAAAGNESAVRVADEFGIDPDAALVWLSQTRWAQQPQLDEAALQRAADVLLDAGLIAELPQL